MSRVALTLSPPCRSPSLSEGLGPTPAQPTDDRPWTKARGEDVLLGWSGPAAGLASRLVRQGCRVVLVCAGAAEARAAQAEMRRRLVGPDGPAEGGGGDPDGGVRRASGGAEDRSLTEIRVVVVGGAEGPEEGDVVVCVDGDARRLHRTGGDGDGAGAGGVGEGAGCDSDCGLGSWLAGGGAAAAARRMRRLLRDGAESAQVALLSVAEAGKSEAAERVRRAR